MEAALEAHLAEVPELESLQSDVVGGTDRVVTGEGARRIEKRPYRRAGEPILLKIRAA